MSWGTLEVLRLLLLLLSLFGCQSAPKKFIQESKAQWDAQAIVRDLDQKKSFVLDIGILAEYSKFLRMEVNTPHGIEVMSFLYDQRQGDGKITAAFHQPKRFLTGYWKNLKTQYFRSGLLKNMPLFTIGPDRILDILFERDFPSDTWLCKKDRRHYLLKCESKISAHQAVIWEARDAVRRKVRILLPGFDVSLDLKGFKPLEQIDPQTFVVEFPRVYKAMK